VAKLELRAFSFIEDKICKEIFAGVDSIQHMGAAAVRAGSARRVGTDANGAGIARKKQASIKKPLRASEKIVYDSASSDVVTNVGCNPGNGALSSVGRAEPLQGLGREFEPLSAHHEPGKAS
jgi:hypothetical protein